MGTSKTPDPAYLVTTDASMFRPGIPARILGVVSLPCDDPEFGTEANYRVLYADGTELHVPVEWEWYEIITQQQFDRGEFPKVTN